MWFHFKSGTCGFLLKFENLKLSAIVQDKKTTISSLFHQSKVLSYKSYMLLFKITLAVSFNVSQQSVKKMSNSTVSQIKPQFLIS